MSSSLQFTAVIAVGDCDPAAHALDAASSATPQMSALLASARQRAKQWLLRTRACGSPMRRATTSLTSPT